MRYIFNYFGPKELAKERPQPVVLTQVLPDAINTHFEGVGGKLVDTINDVKITRLADVAAALAKSDEAFVKIRLVGEGRPLVLDRERAAEASTRINTEYGVGEPVLLEPKVRLAGTRSRRRAPTAIPPAIRPVRLLAFPAIFTLPLLLVLIAARPGHGR